MENDHLLSGLLRKRSEITGEIAFHQERWRTLSQDLVSLDATIQIVAPDYEIGAGHPPIYVPPPYTAYKGEIARLVGEAFRLNPDRALSTLEISEHVMRQRQLNVDDERLKRLITKRVGACLAQWRKKGRVTSQRDPSKPQGGMGGFLLWRLA